MASAPAPRIAAVDTSSAARRVWLVKVPEVVAEIASDHGLAASVLGTFAPADGAGAGGGASSGSGPARKRLCLELNAARVAEALGAERAEHTPLRYVLTLEPPTLGARILTQAAQGTAYSFAGFAAVSGTVTMDPSDKRTTAYQAAKRAESKVRASKAAASRPITLLGAGEAMVLPAVPVNSGMGAAAGAGAASSGGGMGGGALGMDEDLDQDAADALERARAAAAEGPSAPKQLAPGAPLPRGSVNTLLEAFERRAQWSIAELKTLLSLTDVVLKPQLQQHCTYIRSGPLARCWILKEHYRTPGMPVPVEAGAGGSVGGGGSDAGAPGGDAVAKR